MSAGNSSTNLLASGTDPEKQVILYQRRDAAKLEQNLQEHKWGSSLHSRFRDHVWERFRQKQTAKARARVPAPDTDHLLGMMQQVEIAAITEPQIAKLLEHLYERRSLVPLYKSLKDLIVSGRNNRLEWPTMNSKLKAHLTTSWTTPFGPLSELGEQVIRDEELSKRPGLRFHGLHGLFAASMIPRDKVKVLQGLYFRARRQSAIWDLFSHLVKKQLVDRRCLDQPYRIGQKKHPQTKPLVELLECFNSVREDVLLLQRGEITDDQRFPYNDDLDWLATMILRGGSNLVAIFEAIQDSCALYDLNGAAFHNWMLDHLQFQTVVTPDEELPIDSTRFREPVGFWLPHNLAKDHCGCRLAACFDKFRRIEQAFYEMTCWSAEEEEE